MAERYRVSVVVDPEFGVGLFEIVTAGPAWVLDTPANRVVVEQMWQEELGDRVTIFSGAGSESAEETLIAELTTIEDHHGSAGAPIAYDTLGVVGAVFTGDVSAALRRFGFARCQKTETGFIATR